MNGRVSLEQVREEFTSCLEEAKIRVQSEQHRDALSAALSAVEYRDLPFESNRELANETFKERIRAAILTAGLSGSDADSFLGCVNWFLDVYREFLRELIRQFGGYVSLPPAKGSDTTGLELVIRYRPEEGIDFDSDGIIFGSKSHETKGAIGLPPAGKASAVDGAAEIPPILEIGIGALAEAIIAVVGVVIVAAIIFPKPMKKLRKRLGC